MRLRCVLNTIAAALLLGLGLSATAGVVSYQGRVELGGSPYSGPGYFKFAVVDSAGTTTSWSNDGSSSNGAQPTAAITLAVANSLFDVLLGDTALTNMTDLPASAFPSGAVRKLRVWFSTTNGAGSFTQLAPDRRVASAPSALQAEQVANARTVIPFSSGVVVPASVNQFQPLVMGFGASRVVSGFPPSVTQSGQFAFTAPSNGVIERLQVSADVRFVPNTAQGPLNYTFAIVQAPIGAPFYFPTGLSATVLFPAATVATYVVPTYVSASGSTPNLLLVSAGDRLVLQVTSNMFGAPPAIDELGLSAGLLFTTLP